MNKIDVSIVIICMNNLKNLYPCLDSIKRHTQIAYETFVVAYLFTEENLKKLRKDYPWINIIESNSIRGFSENNNLALRQAKGEYCFILNDDTEMIMPTIDTLVQDFKKLSQEVAVVSPVTIYPNGVVQTCGRPPKTWVHYIMQALHLWNEKKGPYVNQKGLFQSYNIIGAAFLIKTKIFKEQGWFDESFFFCPEDIALSTKLNKKGFKCYVDANCKIIHYEGMSGKSLSMTQTATSPAAFRGSLIFYSEGKLYKEIILRCIFFCIFCTRFFIHRIQSFFKTKPNQQYILSIGDCHCIKTCFTRKTPKEIFIKYFRSLKGFSNACPR